MRYSRFWVARHRRFALKGIADILLTGTLRACQGGAGGGINFLWTADTAGLTILIVIATEA